MRLLTGSSVRDGSRWLALLTFAALPENLVSPEIFPANESVL